MPQDLHLYSFLSYVTFTNCLINPLICASNKANHMVNDAKLIKWLTGLQHDSEKNRKKIVSIFFRQGTP
jgi:hypothetical protein